MLMKYYSIWPDKTRFWRETNSNTFTKIFIENRWVSSSCRCLKNVICFLQLGRSKQFIPDGHPNTCWGSVFGTSQNMLKIQLVREEFGCPYCWWLKSCTTWDVWNPINNGINYQPQQVSRISAINSRDFFLFGDHLSTHQELRPILADWALIWLKSSTRVAKKLKSYWCVTWRVWWQKRDVGAHEGYCNAKFQNIPTKWWLGWNGEVMVILAVSVSGSWFIYVDTGRSDFLFFMSPSHSPWNISADCM